MSTSKPTTYVNPADCFQAALDSGRVRPGIAINEAGEFVLCSRKTAARKGWEFQCLVYGEPVVTREPTKA